MPRVVTVAAAQLGPIQRAEPRAAAVGRKVRRMERPPPRGGLIPHQPPPPPPPAFQCGASEIYDS